MATLNKRVEDLERRGSEAVEARLNALEAAVTALEATVLQHTGTLDNHAQRLRDDEADIKGLQGHNVDRHSAENRVDMTFRDDSDFSYWPVVQDEIHEDIPGQNLFYFGADRLNEDNQMRFRFKRFGHREREQMGL